ncbi:MAG: cyclic nucleotide-binding domain-containing protein, partial [Gammaproteobacteria bacterium]|nr:cyclic nucleotide-binding domain-containing protein [Gammaproteobacteria bacterium]NIX88307.1 cyclic nucleotide-binding domain-containing protein [Gammaproteobacteria bacterium]
MAVATKRIDNKILKGLQPLDTLSADKIHELAYKSSIEKYYKGEYLFHQGDEDRRTLYLLAGEVELTTDGRHELVKAKSAQARHPLVIGSPRQASARARSSVSVINIDSDLLDMLLHWENPGTYEVAEFSDDDSADWMLRLLNTSLPPSQIQALLGRLEPVDFREVVLHQNQPVERFAFVKAGRFRFSRRSQSDAEPTIVAELGPGEGFGEELLVADPACCADISVVQNGTLLQIGKEDLEELLVAPLVRELAPDAADLILQDNGLLIDVRTSREYQHDG